MSEMFIKQERLKAAEKCLIDNGIESDEAHTVLQALCYILFDIEIDKEDRH